MVYMFFELLDVRRYQELAAMFAPDGVWYRQNKLLRGPEHVIEAMKQRPAGSTTRLIITKVVVYFRGDDKALASYYMTVVVREDAESPKGLVPLDLQRHVSAFVQTCVRTSEGWHTAELAGTPTFHL